GSILRGLVPVVVRERGCSGSDYGRRCLTFVLRLRYNGNRRDRHTSRWRPVAGHEAQQGEHPGLAVRPMNDVTRVLSALEHGDPHAAAQLLPLVYDELRALAAAQLALERPGQTLDATALVHEAYLRLVGDRPFADRRHFFRVAAEAMRRVLIDRARQKRRARPGGGPGPVPLSPGEAPAGAAAGDPLAPHQALRRPPPPRPAHA